MKLEASYKDFKLLHPMDVLVKAKYKEKFEQESTGIILTINPSVVDDRPTSGEVILIGSSVINIQVGDLVHFNKSIGYDLYFENEPKEWFIVLDYSKILGYQRS